MVLPMDRTASFRQFAEQPRNSITMGCKEILASDLVRCVAAVLIVSRRRLMGRHSKLHETVVVIKFRLMLAALKSGTWCLAQV